MYAADVITVDEETYLATVCINRASIYRLYPDGDMELLEIIVDDRDDYFYTCAFGTDHDTGDLLLAVGGTGRVVKIINITGHAESWLPSHGQDIFAVVWHPVRRHIILSASRDETIRLWNYKTEHLIAQFSGWQAHRYDVLALCFHASGKCCVSHAGGGAGACSCFTFDVRLMLGYEACTVLFLWTCSQ